MAVRSSGSRRVPVASTATGGPMLLGPELSGRPTGGGCSTQSMESSAPPQPCTAASGHSAHTALHCCLWALCTHTQPCTAASGHSAHSPSPVAHTALQSLYQLRLCMLGLRPKAWQAHTAYHSGRGIPWYATGVSAGTRPGEMDSGGTPTDNWTCSHPLEGAAQHSQSSRGQWSL